MTPSSLSHHPLSVLVGTMKTVLKKRADLNNYNKPVVAIAASRTAKVIKGIRSLIVAREVYNAVDGGQSEEDVNVRGGE